MVAGNYIGTDYTGMTTLTSGQSNGYDGVLIYNGGAESIPPFAVVKPTGVRYSNNVLALQVEQPDSQFAQKYYINGPTSMAGIKNADDNLAKLRKALGR